MKEIAEILNEFSKPNIKEIKKLVFLGVDDKDVYNISKSFKFNGSEFIFGRVEPRNNSEPSKVFLFKKVGNEWVPDKRFIPLKDSEDPFISFIDKEWIFGCVEVTKIKERLNYRTVLYKGENPHQLRKFFVGPWGMKDIRFIQLPDGKFAVFSRPQGENGGRGKIGFLIIDSLEKLNERNLYDAPLLNQFSNLEWGGANDIHLLKNGKLGVLGHIAKRNLDNSLSYYPMVFSIDTKTVDYSKIKILLKRANFPAGDSKNERFKDVIFPGGLIRNKDGTAKLYFGAGDAEAYKIVIKDPFLEYEK